MLDLLKMEMGLKSLSLTCYRVLQGSEDEKMVKEFR
jgi:hypothetical protein